MTTDDNNSTEPGAEATTVPAKNPADEAGADETAASEEGTEAEAESDAAEGEEAAQGEEEGQPAAPVNPNFRWYVVHTYSGYENRAKKSLEERIRQNELDEFFGEVLIPTENVVELGKGGQKKTSKRKFFPGYMLVQMELNDESWHLVKSTPKITGFVGSATRPPSIPEAEVRRLTQQIDEGTLKPKPRVQFEEGENVRVIDGPFQNFNGVVDAVNAEKGRVRVLVSIFGRSTPVELEFVQVEKA
jgi:transcriptional antiterminator NusG